MIDTHAHFSREGEGYTIAEQLARACAAGVERIVAVGGNEALNDAACRAASADPHRVHPVVGWDRDQAEPWQGALPEACAELHRQLDLLTEAGTPAVAIGEMGLDYFYSQETSQLQCELFEAQLAFSRAFALPVVVHSRDADADTMALLKAHTDAWRHAGPPGVLHCFTRGAEMAKALVEMGMLISFSGILTFRNADPLRAVAAALPEEALVVETDCPYLAPVPVRSERCEPAFVRHTLACLASVRGVAYEDMAEVTSRNACRLFGLPHGEPDHG